MNKRITDAQYHRARRVLATATRRHPSRVAKAWAIVQQYQRQNA